MEPNFLGNRKGIVNQHSQSYERETNDHSKFFEEIRRNAHNPEKAENLLQKLENENSNSFRNENFDLQRPQRNPRAVAEDFEEEEKNSSRKVTNVIIERLNFLESELEKKDQLLNSRSTDQEHQQLLNEEINKVRIRKEMESYVKIEFGKLKSGMEDQERRLKNIFEDDLERNKARMESKFSDLASKFRDLESELKTNNQRLKLLFIAFALIFILRVLIK